MAKDLTTRIILKGSTDPSLVKAFGEVTKLSEGLSNKVKSIAKRVGQIGLAIGGAAVTGTVMATNAAMDYESAFAGVMKTVDETATTSYDDLSKGIRNMAKEMPATAEEIAAVAESAGQLGIKADDILKFSETMINLGQSTNLSSEEAASSIAKMFNITGTSMDEVDKFGATLVALGNNAATTEADVMNMASRIAGTGKQVGLTETQILAMATTLSSVGMNAELGGSAISQVMTMIDKKVALNAESIEDWAKVAGISASEFKESWKKDAFGTFTKVVNGMEKTKKEGGNLNVLLEELGIKSLGMSDAMKRLAGSGDLLAEMGELANEAWNENTALTDEAGRRYATTASKIQMLKNKLNDVGITIGTAVLPYLQEFVDWLGGLNWDSIAEKAAGMVQTVFETVKSIDWASIGGAVKSAFDMISKAIKWCSENSDLLAGALGALAGAFIGVKIAGFIMSIVSLIGKIKTATTVMGGLKVALAFLGGPVTIVVALIGALVGAFVVLWNKCEGFRNFWINLWENVKSVVLTIGEEIVKFFFITLPAGIEAFVAFLSQLPGKVWAWLKLVVSKVSTFVTDFATKAKEAGSKFYSKVVTYLSHLPEKVWEWLSSVITKAITFVTDFGAKALEAGQAFFDNIVSKVSELPGKMLEIGGDIVKGIWDGISGGAEWLAGKVGGFIDGIVGAFTGKKGIDSGSPSKRFAKLSKAIPQGIEQGILNNEKYANEGISKMGNSMAKTASKIRPTIRAGISNTAAKVKRFANGGTVTSPMNAIVGDAPETIVPHGNSPRNRSLLSEAAAGVGASLGNVINITFAPVINGGNAEENRKMIHDEEQAFEQRMNDFFSGKERLAF